LRRARRRGCEVTRHHFGEGRGDGLYRWDEKRRVALIVVMLITVTFYVWITNRGRRVREVSVL